jgi:hypothetical protein
MVNNGIKDRYYWSAQYFPALLSSFSLALLFSYLKNLFLADWRLSSEVLSWLNLTPLTLSAAVSFWLIQINAYLSKQFFQAPAHQLPSTTVLLHGDSTLSKQFKRELHARIYQEFGVKLLTADKEQDDLQEARKLISSVVARIREKLRSNVHVRRRNISYGFVRNFAGGCVLAAGLLWPTVAWFWHVDYALKGLAIGLAVFYTIMAFLNRFIIQRTGDEYAQTLLEQYASTPVAPSSVL